MKRRSVFGVLLVFALILLAAPARAHTPLPQGIVSVDTMNPHQLRQKILDGYSPEIPWEQAYGEFTDVPAYIPGITVEQAWDYISDTYKLMEWTMSVRNMQPMSPLNGVTRYIAEERLPPGGNTYFLEIKHPETYTIDWWVGHSPEDIWMHYYFRVLDAQEFAGKPGVLLTWVNFGHANFDRDPYLHQAWLMMEIAHGIERDNLVKILQWRAAGNSGPIDTAVMQQLGLINVEMMDPMAIWGFIASQVTPTVSWDTLYDQFIGSHFFIVDAPQEQVWNYLREPENMNQWTLSLRGVHDFGDDLVAIERLSPHGLILGDMDVHPESQMIDLRLGKIGHGHHGRDRYFMNSTLRVFDAATCSGKTGTIVVWISYHHVRYDSSPEYSELWRLLPSKNKLAAQNISLLMAP